jgi:hypothetical protein
MEHDTDDISNLSTSTIVREEEGGQSKKEENNRIAGANSEGDDRNCRNRMEENDASMMRSINKEALVSIIREWVKNDNEIRELKKQETARKNANKALTARLIEIMRSNQLDCFDINDGCILYKKTNVKKPLSKKTLYQLLNEYYKDDLGKANEVSEFLMEKREQVVKEKIVRKLWDVSFGHHR